MTLPGIMSGQILAGANPLAVAQSQIFLTLLLSRLPPPALLPLCGWWPRACATNGRGCGLIGRAGKG
ncbi:ABC transporter permease [Rhizobium sp.]|uniref:ABC transporter permease n=1 Tax=Rhizobium sp. TaxID=391 RepID=UPI003916D317